MVKPMPAPNHPDAAVRWLADRLARSAKTAYEETLPSQALPAKAWLSVRQRLEFELRQHVVRGSR